MDSKIDYLGEAGIGKFYYTGENDTEFFRERSMAYARFILW